MHAMSKSTNRRLALMKFFPIALVLALGVLIAPTPAQADAPFQIRLETPPAWFVDKTSDVKPYWPTTPANWRSFLGYFTAMESNNNYDGTGNKFRSGQLTYLLTNPQGDPIPNAEVSLAATGRGLATGIYSGAVFLDGTKRTDANGRVTFKYFINTDAEEQAYEPRPASILRTACYASCQADWPDDRGYIEGTYPNGLKLKDFFEIDIVPMVPSFEANIGKDQVWLHVINPTLRKPAPMTRGLDPDMTAVETRILSLPGKQNYVGGLVAVYAQGWYGHGTGYNFKTRQVWYACTKKHAKVSLVKPADCTAQRLKFGKYRAWVVPSTARGKYVAGGYVLSNIAGSTLVIGPTDPNRIR